MGNGKNGSGEQCNMYKDFKAWLNRAGKKQEMEWLHSLGPFIGDRFWAIFKNTAYKYILKDAIFHFLD
jgi:hypothetical protein